MGRINAGILAGFSGRVGPVSGSSWKGIAYMKTRPQSVALSDSAGSVIARGKWPTLTKMGSVLLAVIVKPLWDRFAQKQSGYNAFIQANYQAIDNAYAIVPPDVITSKGTLDGLASLTMVADASAHTFDVAWVDNSATGNALASDVPYLCVYDPTTDNWSQFGGEGDRTGEGGIVDPIVPIVAGRHYHLYASMRRADGSLVSNSQHLDVVAVA